MFRTILLLIFAPKSEREKDIQNSYTKKKKKKSLQ